MTATYSITLAAIRDRIRFQLGDTDTALALVADEEIAAVLTLKSNVEADALVYLAKGLLRRYGREPVKVTQDGQTLDFTGRIAVWQELVADAQAAATTTVTAGIRVRRLNRPANISTTTEYTGSETARARIYGPRVDDDEVLEGAV